MKTKFVLCGGFAPGPDERRLPFFAELLKDAPDRASVLLVYFARSADERVGKSAADQANLATVKRVGQTLEFAVASDDDFLNQVRAADVIFLRGGDTVRLLAALRNYENLGDHFSGKTVGGESAGAYVLSRRFFSKSAGGLFEGLGLVPVQTICHHEGSGAENLPEDSALERLLLANYEVRTFIL